LGTTDETEIHGPNTSQCDTCHPLSKDEDLLRAQQWRDKLMDYCADLYEHFHGGERYFKDHGEEDFIDSFDRTLYKWFSRNRLPTRVGVSFYAEVCGVHKSSMSRYLRCLGWRERIRTAQPENDTETPDGLKAESLSQNQLLRIRRWSQRGQFLAECIDRGLSDEDRVKELRSRKFKGEQDRRTGKAAREEDKNMPVLFVKPKGAHRRPVNGAPKHASKRPQDSSRTSARGTV